MKRIKKPALKAIEVFDSCVAGVTSHDLVEKFSSSRITIEAQFERYDANAENHNLGAFPACAWGNDQQTIIGSLTKGELVNLYTSQMAEKTSLGRRFYDQLLLLAPLGICPFCGFGHASTLDHFLSKARYPAFSVLTTNLIPACKDCNTGKGSSISGPNGSIIHPYFEDDIIYKEAWLFAEVVETTPPTLRYFVNPPANWAVEIRNRIRNHFRSLNLAHRFSIQAASEIIEVGDLLRALESSDDRRAHLLTITKIERSARPNSWKAPMYEALSSSDWYLADGYQNPY